MSKKFNTIKALKKMKLIPTTKQHIQLMFMGKVAMAATAVLLLLMLMSGCSTIHVVKEGKVLEEIERVYDNEDVIRDIELKIQSLPTQSIELMEGVCWSERMGVHFCPDGRTY
tara:strand:+ start:3916 stop:4254 length:339 start_codon:yes stop_codon:yes gene_type:complete